MVTVDLSDVHRCSFESLDEDRYSGAGDVFCVVVRHPIPLLRYSQLLHPLPGRPGCIALFQRVLGYDVPPSSSGKQSVSWDVISGK